MANIGATTAFYKVETSLTRANNEVSKSMERLATGKANANAGDRSSYAAMADTFRLDYVGTKAGIKGASVVHNANNANNTQSEAHPMNNIDNNNST